MTTKTDNALQRVRIQYAEQLQELFEQQYVNATRHGQSPKQAARATERIVTGNNITMQFFAEGDFEATLSTLEGPKYISGVEQANGDAGAVEECRQLSQKIDRRIRQLSGHPQPSYALQVIRSIWQSAESTCELAAARSRLVLGKLAPVRKGQIPDWFERQVSQWEEEDRQGVNPAALRAAQNVVSAVHTALPDLEGQVSVGMLGRVVVDWIGLTRRTRWMIEATDLSWPAVRIYEAKEDRQVGFATSVKHDMLEALESLHEVSKCSQPVLR